MTNVYGGSGEKVRGSWCTPKWMAELIGPVSHDPCSNPRSHIEARLSLMLENGDDGLWSGRPWNPGEPGTFQHVHPKYGVCHGRTHEEHVVFINPDYGRGMVERWIAHYQHTRFIFLLKWSPDTKWFKRLLPQCDYVWFPNRRVNFEPPPGVTASNNPMPHALYLRKPSDELLGRLRGAGYLLRVDAALLDFLLPAPQSTEHEAQHRSDSGDGG